MWSADALAQRCVLAVTALQHAHEPASAADVGDLHDFGGSPGEVLRLQVDAHAGCRLAGELAAVAHVARRCVEADGQQDKSGVEGAQRRNQAQLDGLAVTLPAGELACERGLVKNDESRLLQMQ